MGDSKHTGRYNLDNTCPAIVSENSRAGFSPE